MPEKVAYVWHWYADLTWLGTSMQDIGAYFSLKKIQPTQLELDAIIELIKISKEADQ